MRIRPVTYVPLLFLLLALVACGNPQEEARIKLGQMNLKYNEDTFVRLSRDGDIQAVKLFLQAGMSPNVTSQKGETPLVVAARYGRQEVAEVLLAQGADPNTGGPASRRHPAHLGFGEWLSGRCQTAAGERGRRQRQRCQRRHDGSHVRGGGRQDRSDQTPAGEGGRGQCRG